MDTIARIRARAREMDVTMNALCRRIGKSSSYFADKARAGRPIPDGILEQIAERLDTTAAWLRGETEDPARRPAALHPAVNDDPELNAYLEMLATRPECRMLFSLTRDASKADVEKAVAIIEALRRSEREE